VAHSAGSKEDIAIPLQDRYKKAKFFYKQLETDPKLGAQRSLWLKSSSNFRKVYLSNPKSELAPASLFMLGRIYLRMYEIFQEQNDLNESISYYRDCTSLFPNHRLADDSLYALGEIYLNSLSQYETAGNFFSQVVTRYPHGDMHPQAGERLKQLSSKYDIALPDAMLGSSIHKKLTNVLPVKYWSSNDYSRVIIKASGPVTYSAQLLEKSHNQPRRLYIDFQNSYIEPQFRSPVPISDGLLKQIRTGQNTQETVRVVLDIESISSYKIFSLPDPFRVVVDIRGVAAEHQPPMAGKNIAALPKPALQDGQIIVLKEQKKRIKHRQPKSSEIQNSATESTDTQEFSLAQQLGLGVKRIVIDPGHGGKDPGAIANGLKEKDIVLKLALKVKQKLEETIACDVILTRTKDEYISLEERTAIANGNNADLFISLHVNAHPQSSVHGLETYFLNLSSDRDAMRVAAFENATSELQMSDLQDVLADIMKNSKVKESSRLAQNIHSTLLNGLEEEKLTLRDLGVKQAPFYVLIGAEMPAILMEIAFISNHADSNKLKNDQFIGTVADNLIKGIRAYMDSNIARLSY
jgi:N-acetylmuramoyl-L-alanine amidase